ncbi:hypothetical protein MED297_15665 [Reinekea sp. MED297]|uniref:DUF5610 domain-containing protein n=2 Tax=Reinekea TaxID=230494 RepID=A4BIQ7_9GAMM|nr:hypothetical protein MED297_15665 [Reinekea sp. MED297] [Reinekea blandensis MED297]
MPATASQWSYSSTYSRYESQSYQKLDQPPVSTQGAAKTENANDAEATSAAQNFNVDALVDKIWSFASERIAKAKADGASEEELASLWEAAEKGVEQGFSEARDVLSAMGEDSDELTMKIDSAYGQLMDKLGERNLDDAESSGSAQSTEPAATRNNAVVDRMIQMQQYERQTFSLDLKTSEGDVIQIRAVNENAASLSDSRFGRQASTQWSSVEMGGYSLMVKGDLNEQEMEDLDALLGEVNELAEEFYNGDYQTAFSMAKDLNIDGTTLKSLNLSMQEVEQKAASVYAETAGETTRLPRGLEPLQQYAEKLMQAQEKWQERFEAPSEFLKTLGNHPMNRGEMLSVAEQLMM